MTTLCDTCPAPGTCCRAFHPGPGGAAWKGLTSLEVMAGLADMGLPFAPLYQHANGAWLFWCPNLGRDGRCRDYENRPATCRDFEPGSDVLCVLHDGHRETFAEYAA